MCRWWGRNKSEMERMHEMLLGIVKTAKGLRRPSEGMAIEYKEKGRENSKQGENERGRVLPCVPKGEVEGCK